jgi:hypothetical protein
MKRVPPFLLKHNPSRHQWEVRDGLLVIAVRDRLWQAGAFAEAEVKRREQAA